MPSPTIVWLRDDLRLADNPALVAAAERGEPVVLVYLRDEESEGIRPMGGASLWWLHHSLASLAADAPLVLRTGPAERIIPELVAEVGAGAVLWNRRYDAAREVDARLKQRLRDDGVDARSFQANLLFEPGTVMNGSGQPFKVFTPFWKAVRELPVREPYGVPEVRWRTADSEPLDDWGLLPTHPDWAGGLRETWTPGEHSAHDTLESFATDRLPDYHRRDEPGLDSTSSLSPHLSFGEISPFQIWHRVHGDLTPAARKNVAKFLSELGWREFNWSILFHQPDLHERNHRREFDAFPWHDPSAEELDAWRYGRTGIPLVDAGMRQLWHTGAMHNRVRLVCASFLIKNMLVDWRVGEAWFWDTLVDADRANNAGNWQWVAGSGADAAPYFRVFNPVLQAEKFDPDREYIRRWVPEVDSPEYPQPMLDLAETRRRALAAYEQIRGGRR